MNRIKESDWKLLRDKLPGWQEAFMGELMCSYADIANSNALASERFWELDKRIREDKKSLGVVVHGLSRSNAEDVIVGLLAEGVISPSDLEGFSDEIKDGASYVLGRLHALEGLEGDDPR